MPIARIAIEPRGRRFRAGKGGPKRAFGSSSGTLPTPRTLPQPSAKRIQPTVPSSARIGSRRSTPIVGPSSAQLAVQSPTKSRTPIARPSRGRDTAIRGPLRSAPSAAKAATRAVPGAPRCAAGSATVVSQAYPPGKSMLAELANRSRITSRASARAIGPSVACPQADLIDVALGWQICQRFVYQAPGRCRECL